APLLEKERDPGLDALVADLSHPGRVDWAAIRTALATNDYPIDAFERQIRDRSEQGFHRKEPHGCRNRLKILHARDVCRVLDRHALPHVGRPRHAWRQHPQPGTTLREDLEPMPMGATHRLEDLADERLGDFLVKEITHAVHENPSWSPPPER